MTNMNINTYGGGTPMKFQVVDKLNRKPYKVVCSQEGFAENTVLVFDSKEEAIDAMKRLNIQNAEVVQINE